MGRLCFTHAMACWQTPRHHPQPYLIRKSVIDDDGNVDQCSSPYQYSLYRGMSKLTLVPYVPELMLSSALSRLARMRMLDKPWPLWEAGALVL